MNFSSRRTIPTKIDGIDIFTTFEKMKILFLCVRTAFPVYARIQNDEWILSFLLGRTRVDR
jgi:hypothetical protein